MCSEHSRICFPIYDTSRYVIRFSRVLRFLQNVDETLATVTAGGYWQGNRNMKKSQSYSKTFGESDSCLL